jgi:hypothetical protein
MPKPEHALDEDPPFDPEGLAVRWICTPQTITAMCRRGELKAFKVGKGWRIGRRAVAEKEHGEAAAS